MSATNKNSEQSESPNKLVADGVAGDGKKLILDQAIDITNSVENLEKELHLLNSHNFIKMHNSLFKLIRFQFLKGLAFGFGSVVGATLLVSFLVYLASTIEFVPIIGEWVNQVMSEIKMPDDTSS